MNDEAQESVEPWFPEELSDEAAAAIYLFLEQFAQSFGQRYAQQIDRHWVSCREDTEWNLPPENNDNQSSSWEDDDIDF
jgi:hypothetical protein